MEELNSTSSSSSLTAVLNNQMNILSEQRQTSSTSSLLLTPTNPTSNLGGSPQATTALNKPESANMRIIETRFDANEIINQIENELTNRLGNLKQINAQTASTSTGQLSPHNESFS